MNYLILSSSVQNIFYNVNTTGNKETFILLYSDIFPKNHCKSTHPPLVPPSLAKRRGLSLPLPASRQVLQAGGLSFFVYFGSFSRRNLKNLLEATPAKSQNLDIKKPLPDTQIRAEKY